MRTPIIAGNWKLNLTIAESRALASAIAKASPESGAEVIVAPVSLSLSAVAEAASGTPLKVAAQHTHAKDSGAFTGELSPALIQDAGASHCIVGHSERRSLFGETDAGVNEKVKALQAQGLIPIVCIGETLAQREAGDAISTVTAQVAAALEGVDVSKLVLAYEPVWAIGTGKTAAPADAQEVHAAIRAWLTEHHASLAQQVQILYGGSVKPANAAELLAQSDIDGALVGGASLKAETFIPIIEAAIAS